MPFSVVEAVAGIAEAVGVVGEASGLLETVSAIGGVASAVGDAFGGGGGGGGGTNNQNQTSLAQQYLNQQQARSTADAAQAALDHPERGNAAAEQQQNLADPFSPYRSGFAEQYSSAMQPGANLSPEGMPGYSQFKSGVLDPSMEATQRTLNASGMFASGNEQIALQKTASQGYSGFMTDYLNRLAMGSGANQNAASGAQQGMEARNSMNQMVGQAAGANQYAKAQGQQLGLNALSKVGNALSNWGSGGTDATDGAVGGAVGGVGSGGLNDGTEGGFSGMSGTAEGAAAGTGAADGADGSDGSGGGDGGDGGGE